MIAVPEDLTLKTACLTALCSSAAAGMYATLRVEPSPLVALVLSAGPLFAVILWLEKDAQRTGAGVVQDWGLFLWLAWPVLIPWYAFKTRGHVGWRLALGLFALIFSAYVTSAAVPWLLYGIRYTHWYLNAGA